jgi:hypothetical protein
MFSFTTYTQAAFMGMHDSDDALQAPKGDFKVKNPKPIWLSAYIHGEAENLVGYDVPVFIDGELGDELEQDCTMKYNGNEEPCVLIQWSTGETRRFENGDREVYRGLFCLKTDQDSIDYARKCAREKRNIL